MRNPVLALVGPTQRYQLRASFGIHRGHLAWALTLTEARAYLRHYIAQGLNVVTKGGELVLVDRVDGTLSYDGGKSWEACSAALREVAA